MVIGDDIERGEFGGISAALLDDRPADRALQGSKPEHAMLIVAKQELQKAPAETAHAVIQNQVRPGGRRRRLRV